MALNDSGLTNLLKLSGLKNASGRRTVMKGPSYLEDEGYEPDISGTASPLEEAPIAPPDNSPQSYDVRANEIVEPQQEESVFRRIGRALYDYVSPSKREEQSQQNQALISQANRPVTPQKPPIETEQVDVAEGIPPVSASEQMSAAQNTGLLSSIANEAQKPWNPEIGNALSRFAEGTKNYLKDSFTPKLDEAVFERSPELKKYQQPNPEKEQQQIADQQEIDRASQNHEPVAVYGATDQFAQQPELVAQFKEYTGLNFDEQQKEMTAKYEKVLSDLESNLNETNQGYDEQQARLKERIMNNQATDADKFYIGLALLMPLIVGGLFGKEAGLGALAGSSKGFADILQRRGKDIAQDEELLSDVLKEQGNLNLKRGEIDIERAKIPSEVKKMLPKDEYEDIKGMKIAQFKDPTTGEIVGEGVTILPDLYADLSYYNTPEKRKEAYKNAKELSSEKAALERANAATEDVIKAVSQLEDPGVTGILLSYALSEDKNGALKKFAKQSAPDIFVDGRKQNAAVYLDSKIEQIKDAYRRNEQMRAFTNTVAQHIGNMAENPLYSGLKPTDLIDQMLVLRDRSQNFFVDRAESQGFLGDPLKNIFGKENKKIYGQLNRKEEKKQIEDEKAKIIRNNR